MNGNMYWIAEMVDDNSVDSPFDTRTFFIQCFDFSKEVFKETCGLPFVKRDAWLLPRLSGFGGDRLSLLAQHKNGKIQVWVTNNLSDEVVSWSMYFDVTPDNFRILTGSPTYLVHKTNRIMLWCEEEDVENINIYVNVYEIGEGFVEKQVETGRRRRCDKVYKHSRCFVFVPSLVPVPK
ncbi:unnamed protein product [Eruca vesicaria subsp. sativa]|uniref:F-box associated beta-propeller type 1 domain-containing protein n=1 Tax=Eruca vesicaria subsp. sativa TaxID=29727 RepID=A0ABC8JUZ0_ERUVS|nr:unnamed protein product [Eruca vesicaria subsp. sativa]